MAEDTTRLVPVKLPGGNQVQVKVPTQWGPEQIRAELVKRGVLPGETPSDTPAQEIPPAQPLTAQDVAVAAKRAVNAGVTQFWHDMNEADRLLRSAVRGTDEEGASMGVARRAGLFAWYGGTFHRCCESVRYKRGGHCVGVGGEPQSGASIGRKHRTDGSDFQRRRCERRQEGGGASLRQEPPHD